MTTINADPQEINKFEQIAASWWEPMGPFQALHDINPLRLDFIKQHAQLNGQKILDVGCGGGILTESLAKEKAQVMGIDLSPTALKTADQHQDGLGIDYQEISVETLAKQQPASFDVVTCMELLEHVPEPQSVITACAELVKPGGFVFFATLNRHPKAYLMAIIGAEYLMNMLPRGTHDYDKFIRPSELEHWARNAELHCQALRGMSYNPLTKIYRQSSNVDVNYLMALQKVTES